MNEVPVYEINIPEYHVESKPDHEALGAKVDKVLRSHFAGKKVAIRCLTVEEHPNKTVDEMVEVIKRLGTDRYDPSRAGDRYENVEGHRIDLFALDFEVGDDTRMMEKFIEPFYTWPIELHGKPQRLDIVIVYDLDKLDQVVHTYEGRDDVKKDGFVFKDPEHKPEALLGIVKLL